MIDNRMGDSGMEDKEDYLSTLNERQLAAVTTTEGYVRIIAGAGTGKTKALTHRYAYLVNELGISTSNILCVTFTNKAAREVSKRIRQMIGHSDTGYHIVNYLGSTFLASRIIVRTCYRRYSRLCMRMHIYSREHIHLTLREII